MAQSTHDQTLGRDQVFESQTPGFVQLKVYPTNQ